MIRSLVPALAAMLLVVTLPPPAFAADDYPPRRPSGPMACEPGVLHAGDTLRVTLPFPHGPYFTIRAPGNRPYTYFFLAEPWVNQAQAGTDGIGADEFSQMTQVTLDVSKATARPYVFDAKPTVIFKRSGTYLLEVGEQFATEADLVEGYCTVEFRR